MKLRRFRRALYQVSILPILVLGITSAALYFQIASANRTVALIERSDQRISQATLAAKLIVDEETGLRGLQNTGDERFLQPYLQAQMPLDSVFQKMDSTPGSIGPDGIPLHGIVALRTAHTAWEQSFALPLIASARAGKKIDTGKLNLRGKDLMDRVRSELDSVIRRAEERRAARIHLWQMQTRWIEVALFGLALVSAVLISLFTRNRMHWVSDAYRRSLEDLTVRAEKIFASEQLLRTTLTSIGDGVITCDPAGRIQMMNTVAEDLTGWIQGEAHLQPLEDVFRIVNETTRVAVENPVAKVRRLNRIVGLANHTVLLRRDGTELQIADSGAPIRDAKGEIMGFVMVFRDVTLERRTQDALIAQEKLAVAERLAATIAHEINNPLSSVLDMLYLMRNGVGELEYQQYMHMAEAELKRVAEIVRSMLGLYRESNSPIPVNLGATMHEILLLVERRFADVKVHVTSDLPDDICVMGFPAELRQVFTNLISNAAEATGKGGQVSITVASESDGTGTSPVKGASVMIRDNGPGIPEHILAQLFQPFFTTKGERGTGLGLWVSRGIVAKHNGSIDLRSSTQPEDHGTTARIFLPGVVALESSRT